MPHTMNAYSWILVWKKKKKTKQNKTWVPNHWNFLGCISTSYTQTQRNSHRGCRQQKASTFVPKNGRLLTTLTFPSGTVAKMRRWKACLGMWIRMTANSSLPLSDLIVHICIPPLRMPKQWPVHPLLTSQMLKTKQTTALPNMVKLSFHVEQHLEKEWGDLKEIFKEVCGEWVF